MSLDPNHMTQICLRAFDSVGVNFDLVKIRSKSRKRDIVTHKRLAVYALMQAGYGPTEIGRFIHHDHATVLHHKRTSYLLSELPSHDEKVLRERIDYHYKEIARLEGYLKTA